MGVISYIYGKIETKDSKVMYIKEYFSNGKVIKFTLSSNPEDNMPFRGQKRSKMCIDSPNYAPLIRVRNVLKNNAQTQYLKYRKMTVTDTADNIEKKLTSSYSKMNPIVPGTRVIINDEVNNKIIDFRYAEDPQLLQKKQETLVKNREKNLHKKTLAYVFRFGKHKGKTLTEVYNEDVSYLRWIKEQYWVDEYLRSYINYIFKNNTNKKI